MYNIYARKLNIDFFREFTAFKFQVAYKVKSRNSQAELHSKRIMGKTRRISSSVGTSHSMNISQDGRILQNDLALEERRERLQKVLEQRRQERTEARNATPTTSGSADLVTETTATSKAVPDNKKSKSVKK